MPDECPRKNAQKIGKVNPEFLTLDDILEIHGQQIERFGGINGLRDQGLLESALAQPSMMFFGQYLHPDLLTMAGAYLCHIILSAIMPLWMGTNAPVFCLHWCFFI